MNRIVFLGMDLSGKSRLAKNIANKFNVELRNNLLTKDKDLYKTYVYRMKSEGFDDQEVLAMFGHIYEADLEKYDSSLDEKDKLIIQDNFGIVRCIVVNDVLDYVKIKYKEILPKANIVCINKKFDESINFIPDNIDLFLANHCIDDLIIFEYSQSEYNKEIKSDVISDELLKIWENLYNDLNTRRVINNKIINLFEELFRKKNINLIVMGQYKSYLYYSGKSNHIDEIIDECFQKIKQLTNTDDKYINKLLDFYPLGVDNERYGMKLLIDNTQNAKNWIVGTFKQE